MPQRIKRQYSIQISVALADILANSVAVILILIAITLTVLQQRADEEIQRNIDITSLLSRQMASTIVYNDLPSSPPARLHDYYSCAIPHDCNPLLFPIIEFLDGHIRIFNSNTRIYRGELMREENAFDRYLLSLTQQERLNIRADIHYVSEYYIAVGIMQEHNIRPRHWHYLGEQTAELENRFVSEEKVGNTKGNASLQKSSGEGENTNRGGQSQTGDQVRQSKGALPDQTQLAGAQTLSSLSYNNLLPPANSGACSGSDCEDTQQTGQDTTAEDFSTQGEQQNNASGQYMQQQGISQQDLQSAGEMNPYPNFGSQKPRALFSATIATGTDSQSQSSSQGNTGNKPKRLIVRVPNSEKLDKLDQTLKEAKGQLDADLYNKVILNYLIDLLKIADNEKTLDLQQAIDMLESAPQNALNKTMKPKTTQLINKIDRELQSIGIPSFRIFSSTEFDSTLMNNKLRIQLNTPKPEVRFIAHTQQVGFVNFEGTTAQPSMLMRLYPTIYKGEILDFPEAFTLLVHPDQLLESAPKWRPVAVFDNEISTISLGFLHFGIDAEGWAEFDTGINHISLNFVPLSQVAMGSDESQGQRMKLLWLLSIVMLLVLLTRHRRNKSQ